MTSNQCAAITGTGARCTRKAVIDGLCTQHHNIYLKNNNISKENKKIEIDLLPELTNHILSDYIEYDELQDLQDKIQNLNIDKNRINIIEYNKQIKYLSDQDINSQAENIYHVIDTKIDDKLRKKEIYSLKNNIKLKEINYNADEKINGTEYEWYPNGKIKSKRNYVNGLKQDFQYLWYPSGILESKISFKNDKQDGPDYNWYPNGMIKYFFNYKDDMKDGDNYTFLFATFGKGTIYEYFKNGKIRNRRVIIDTEASELYDRYTKIMSEQIQKD
jgi:antitoxin component YwqK of YwqJK toxin-antitoxin module